ncbi:hypothetical protein NP493_212g08025 [Ridgeia piscesae]|uniref:Secreted protein n=1 Tax=Ridgeia piscesae TaxID=27915 RepID=A0AAD9P130_RIDPI|nr:hypothetical protein NP493_212g08025 [Ridgeia piscesae]
MTVNTLTVTVVCACLAGVSADWAKWRKENPPPDWAKWRKENPPPDWAKWRKANFPATKTCEIIIPSASTASGYKRGHGRAWNCKKRVRRFHGSTSVLRSRQSFLHPTLDTYIDTSSRQSRLAGH